MFERFTEPARQVVVFAQEEARTLRHNYIGTEHLLLGLLREGGAGARALNNFHVTHQDVQTQVARLVGPGDEVVRSGQIPFTPRAKKVLELSLREALNNSDKYIGPEHILLGLVREGEGVGGRMLMGFGQLEQIRAATLEVTTANRTEEEGKTKPQLSLLAPEVIEELKLFRAAVGGRAVLSPLLVGWVLFAVALGVGVLIGWAIWG